MNCRHCKCKLENVFADLAFSPISNDMLKKKDLLSVENYYPLKVFVCENCLLVQLDEFKKAGDIFNEEYTYFSSFSSTWIEHTKKYTDQMIERFGFDSNSLVVEIASNDGCLLQHFVKNNVPVLGIEPTANTAKEARKKGVDTLIEFFSTELAKNEFVQKEKSADLIVGNNVLAHVPDINDFVKGMKLALNKTGVITMEFPHLMKLVEDCQFDTIYHEHFSYLSLLAVKNIFESQGLEVFDVDEISTHGGSLRIYAKHIENNLLNISQNVTGLLKKEKEMGMDQMIFYADFQNRIDKIKYDTLSFLIDEKQKGKKIVGYGAASKGNTLINYTGIKGTDLIEFVVDASPFKQDKFLPGSHIPVVSEERIKQYKPDYVIILPWNLKNEISNQLDYIKVWGGKFVYFIPEKTII